MSKVFLDSMLFIYVVEDHPTYAAIVRDLLARCLRRGDSLYTSHLSVAETLVGIPNRSEKEKLFVNTVVELGFTFSAFDRASVQPFRALRSEFGLKPPDAMNLACAAGLGVDMYLTNDAQLLKKHLHVPGIHFIAHFERAPL